MKIYCQKCGSGNEYSLEKPNFCQSCGNSFKTLKASASASLPTNRANTVTQQLEEEESSISLEKIQSMSSLDVEFSVADRKSKIGNLIGTSQGGSIAASFNERKDLNKQEVLESLKREAGFYPVVRNNSNEEE